MPEVHRRRVRKDTQNATLFTSNSTAYIQPFYPQLITLTPLLLLFLLDPFATNTLRPLPLTQTQSTRPLTLPLQPPLFFLPRPLLLLSGQALLLHLMHLTQLGLLNRKAAAQPHKRNDDIEDPHRPQTFRVHSIRHHLLLRREMLHEVRCGARGTPA